MITISKESAVYKFMTKFHTSDYTMPRDTCRLIRGFTFSILVATVFWSLVILAVLALVAVPATYAYAYFISGMFVSMSSIVFFELLHVILTIEAIAAGGIAMAFIMSLLFTNVPDAFRSLVTKSKEVMPSFVREVYKGFKEKYCPTVTYTD